VQKKIYIANRSLFVTKALHLPFCGEGDIHLVLFWKEFANGVEGTETITY
jgi:hypothetical protein